MAKVGASLLMGLILVTGLEATWIGGFLLLLSQGNPDKAFSAICCNNLAVLGMYLVLCG